MQTQSELVLVGGSICSTRLNTGFGVPNLSAIFDCETAWNNSPLKNTMHKPALIIDGGIRNAGDIVKALAAGADFVMCGSLLSGTDETPGKILTDEDSGKRFKSYRGMASRESQTDFSGVSSAPEGIATHVSYKGPLKPILDDLAGNIRSGLSYCGANNLHELRRNVTFIRQSHAGLNESFTHILKK